jgi:hypothetical protein
MALVFNLVDGDELSIDGPARIAIAEKSGRRTKVVVVPEEGTKVTRSTPSETASTFAGRMGLTRGVGGKE